MQQLPAILERIWTAPKPVVARLSGPARAGGIGLVAACDIAIAADSVTFGFSEVRIGVIPAVISAPLRRTVSTRALHELFLTGETFDAARAVDIALINRAVAAEALDDEVDRVVAMLLCGAPGAVAGAKELLRRGADGSLASELQELVELSGEYFAGEEGQEGIAAFRERRSSRWLINSPEAPR